MTPILRAFLIAAALLLPAAPAFADPAQNGPWISASSLLGAPNMPRALPGSIM